MISMRLGSKKIFACIVIALVMTMSAFLAGCRSPKGTTTKDQVKLATPKIFNISNTTLTFEKVANATSYELANTDKEAIRTTTTNSFDLTDFAVGHYTLSVRAISSDNVNFLPSEWSESVDFYKEQGGTDPTDPVVPGATKLATPQNLQIDAANKTLTFGAVANATSYELRRDDSIPYSNVFNSNTIDLNFLTTSGTYNLSVRATSTDTTNYTTSEWSTKTTYTVENTGGGSTDPDDASGRLQKLLSRESYEKLFPARFGTPLWKQLMTGYYYTSDGQSKTDFYTYDSLVQAVEEISNKVITREEKLQSVGGEPFWDAYREMLFDKTTQTTIEMRKGTTWDDISVPENQIRTTTTDYGDFLTKGDENTQRRELSAFLANVSHETGEYGTFGPTNEGIGGLVWNEELAFISGNVSIDHYTQANDTYPPVAGKSYHGRGAIQLSWNYNYGFFSQLVFGDKSVLLNEPEKVIQDGKLAFMSAIWFWMTPQWPKASMHQAIVTSIEDWPLSGASSSASRYNPSFALTIIIINGGYEENVVANENGTDVQKKVARRIMFYEKLLQFTNGVLLPNEKLDTSGWSRWE